MGDQQAAEKKQSVRKWPKGKKWSKDGVFRWQYSVEATPAKLQQLVGLSQPCSPPPGPTLATLRLLYILIDVYNCKSGTGYWYLFKETLYIKQFN